MPAQQLHTSAWGPRRQGCKANEQLPTRQRALAQSRAGSSQAKDPENYIKRTAQPEGQSQYLSSDGRVKATLADAYIEQTGHMPTARRQPWNMGWQVSERDLQWNDEIAAQLVKVAITFTE